MSGDFNGKLNIKGTIEEKKEIIKILNVFEKDNLAQYRKNRDCFYIDMVCLKGLKGKYKKGVYLNQLSAEELGLFLAKAGDEFTVEFSGPWGAFAIPGDFDFFEILADSAPDAYISGKISGFDSSEDVDYEAELKNGVLSLTSCITDDEEFGGELREAYAEYIENELPYSKFCELFKVNESDFNSFEYHDLIIDFADNGFPVSMEFEDFSDYCACSKINKKEYNCVIEELSKTGIEDYSGFCDLKSVELKKTYAQKAVYNPKTKMYDEKWPWLK